MTISTRFICLIISGLFLTACASTIKHEPLSETEFYAVDFSAVAPQRWWGDSAPHNLEAGYRRSVEALIRRTSKAGKPLESHALVLSGGSANGAFGVGVLKGWSESGKRPEFDYVTGISTGAIIAPFAFLGSEYDDILADAYTSISQEDIFRSKGIAGVLWGSAFADTVPLQGLLAKHITDDVIGALAREKARGRTLIIQTTQFDALRPVTWDVTAIAAKGGPSAGPLIRKIILASAAVPGLFPPVALEWTTEGGTFTELHVDGAVSSQVFAYPAAIELAKLDRKLGVNIDRFVYVVQNSNDVSFYGEAPVSTFGIVRRALTGLLTNQINNDIERIYHLSARDNVAFNTVAIPRSFKADRANDFDRDYMNALFDVGRNLARSGNFWQSTPPTLGERSRPEPALSRVKDTAF